MHIVTFTTNLSSFQSLSKLDWECNSMENPFKFIGKRTSGRSRVTQEAWYATVSWEQRWSPT